MNTLLRSLIPATAALLVLGSLSLDVHADGGRRFIRENPAGGVTAGAARHHAGPNGAMASRRVLRTDGEGNAMATSGRVWQGANGGVGARAGVTTRSADGSVQHESGLAASSAKGSVTSQGGFTKDAEGNVVQSRNTTATSAATGNSYQGNTSYNKDTGLTHSGTCYDAGGNVIACPSR